MADTINQQVADRLREAADVLALQGANPFRVSAYRKASDTVSRLDRDLRDITDKEGFEGLVALSGVGRSIAAAIHEMLRTGRWSQLDRLRGTLEPERLFRALPGVGPELAHRIHDTLHIETLEALEIAAHDGRLEAVAGLAPRRAAMLRAALASMLSRARPRPRVVTEEPPAASPGVGKSATPKPSPACAMISTTC